MNYEEFEEKFSAIKPEKEFRLDWWVAFEAFAVTLVLGLFLISLL